METTGFYSLIPQKYTNSKQKKKLWNKTIFIVFRKYLKKKSQLITWKKRGFNGYIYDFSVDYNINNTSYIINIHKNLMKKHDIK